MKIKLKQLFEKPRQFQTRMLNKRTLLLKISNNKNNLRQPEQLQQIETILETTWNNRKHNSKASRSPTPKSRERTEMDAAFEKMLDPIAGSPATGKSVAGIINLFVDDLFGTGGTEMEQRVLARLRNDVKVGSEDWNDVLLTGQRIRWMKDPQLGPSIAVSQERAIEELEEIPVEKKKRRSPRRDKLVAEQDTVPVLLQVFQMCFNVSFSNNWWCESS